MTDENTRIRLKQALADLDALPAMPETARKLLTLPLNTEEGETQMLRLIGQDPQISAKVIGLANSPVMGVLRRVGSLSEASMLLGLTRVKSIAIGIASMSGLTKSPDGKYFRSQDLWLHSMAIAVAMNAIARAMPPDGRPGEERIFLAGLLHDIGFIALHHLDAAASDALHHRLKQQPDRPLLEIELETLGITHCYIGAQLARHWHLPEEIVTVLGYHHAPYVEDAVTDTPLLHLVNLAEKIVPDFGIAERTRGEILDQEWVELGIDPAQAGEICARISELAVQTARFGGLSG